MSGLSKGNLVEKVAPEESGLDLAYEDLDRDDIEELVRAEAESEDRAVAESEEHYAEDAERTLRLTLRSTR